jgi:hypothetical protein
MLHECESCDRSRTSEQSSLLVFEKSGTNGNFNYFSYFYLQDEVKCYNAENDINIG